MKQNYYCGTKEIESMKRFFELNQEQMIMVMKTYLKEQYKTVYATDDYVLAVGDIPVALTAHLDTVFGYGKRDIFFDSRQGVMWSPAGLGADDRAGVYSIVQILKEGYRPTVIFTTDEEIGGRGAAKIIQHFPIPPTDLKYIIELDRQGTNDCVFYDCDNPKFEEYVTSFGFETHFGTFTDISIICPVWKIAGVNLSIGYKNEHSVLELLYVYEMQKTIDKVMKMLDNWETADNFEYIPATWQTFFPKSTRDKINWAPVRDVPQEAFWNSDILIKCDTCNNANYDYEMFPVKNVDGSTFFLCPDCLSNRPDIGWCSICSEPFVKVDPCDPYELLCCHCQNEQELKEVAANA